MTKFRHSVMLLAFLFLSEAVSAEITGIALDNTVFAESLPVGETIGSLSVSRNGQPALPLDEGLIAHYPFEGNAQDHSGQKNHALLKGGSRLTEDRFGRSRQAVFLDGDGDWLELNGLSGSLTGAVSFSAWVQASPADLGTRRSLFAANHRLGSNIEANALLLMVGQRSTDTQLTTTLVAHDPTTSINHVVNPTPIADGGWHHLAYVTDGRIAIGYVDGVAGETQNVRYGFRSDLRWSLGQEFDEAEPSDFYKGLVDEVRIYNRQLNAAEVEALYHEPTFRLVHGEGSSENELFKVVSNRMVLAAPANFEVNAAPSIRILATGANGATFEQVHALRVIDANDPPVGITLSPNSVPENQPAGTFVGSLTAMDEDRRDSHTFELVPNAPIGYDNTKFTISKTALLTSTILDFERSATHRLLVKVSDRTGAAFEQEVVLEVENGNDAPTQIQLNGTPREGPAGTVLGELVATDIDPGDSHVFRIIGGADQAAFRISGEYLTSSRTLDYEQQSVYQVKIRATDSKGLFFDQLLDVILLDANDAPTDILLESTTILENQPAQSLVGTFRLIDPDGDWTPVEEPGEPQQFLLDEFSGNSISEDWTKDLINSISLNHSVENGELAVQSIQTDLANKDTEGDWAMVNLSRPITRLSDFEAKWTIAWDQNDAVETTQEMFLVLLGPDEEQIAAVGVYDEWHRHRGVKFTSLPDNDYMTSIGTLAFRDNEDTITVSRSGKIIDVKWNNWLFASSESEVPLARVELLFGEYPATIGDIQTKSGTSIVKELRITGVEAPKAPAYELVEGKGDVDNGFFVIEGNRLLTRQPFNFEAKSQYSIRVKGIDPGDLTTEKVFAITIEDGNDGPTGMAISNHSIAENQERGTIVGELSASDEDSGDVHRWNLLSRADGGSPDNEFFSLSGNQLRSSARFDFEQKSRYTVDVRVTDSLGAAYEEELIIEIEDVNDSPTGIVLSSGEVRENLPPGTHVATLTAKDQDNTDNHTFQIVGGRDQDAFAIKGNRLNTRESFDFEKTRKLDLLVQVTDQRKATFEALLQIHVLNGNDPPTGLLLSNNVIEENLSPQTLVGTLSPIDPDAISTLLIQLHFHNLIGWKTTLGDTQILNDFDASGFQHQVLPRINQFFSTANIRFVLGRTHEENLTRRLPRTESERLKLQSTILHSDDPSSTLHSLMDPNMREVGAFHLYLFPFVGASTDHRAMPDFASHNAMGLWQLDDAGKATRTNLSDAAISSLLAALGVESDTPFLTTEQIRKIRFQAYRGRPVLNAPTAPPFPGLRNVSYSKVPLADQRFNLQQSRSTGWVPYATTHPITQPNTTVRRLLLLTQGVDDSLPETWNVVRQTLANEAQDEKTMLIAPQFLRSEQLAGEPDKDLMHWETRKGQLYGELSGDGKVSEDPEVEIDGTRIDTYELRKTYPSQPENGNSTLVMLMVDQAKASPSEFTFLHLTHTDSAGHGHGWGKPKYHDAIKAVDSDIGLVLDLVENHAPYRGETVILLTADHGGGGDNLYQHTTPTEPLNFTIPFFAWGKGVQAGAELYDLNRDTRTSPTAESNPDYSAISSSQPIRNGTIANLSASILGLPAVPGSWINHRQDLKLASRHVRAKYVIAISVDGLRPSDIEQLGQAALPNLFRLRNEGAYTSNARTDTFMTRTLPNHSSMMTGRGTFDVPGTGVGHNQEVNSDNGSTTLHDNNGTYVHSIFDNAKRAGLQTALYANKSKFELFYRTWNGTWSSGEEEPEPSGPVRMSTGEVIDEFLKTLALNAKLYPNLQEVVLLGHGDGADLLQRYALSNPLEKELFNARRIPVRYLLFGQDSYWLPEVSISHPYGLQSRSSYLQQIDSSEILNNWKTRNLHFLVGEEDRGATDTSDTANLPGTNRFERANRYFQMMDEEFPEHRNRLSSIPDTGHNVRQLLQQPESINAVLGRIPLDVDGDGWADQDEFNLASDPFDPTSFPDAVLPTFQLIEDVGGEHNELFYIFGNQLFTKEVLDFESHPQPSIRIQVTDPAGMSFADTFVLKVTDNNDPPSGITLEDPTVPENQPPGTVVSLIEGIDPDRRDSLTFSLSDPGEKRFSVKGRLLIAEQSFDFEKSPKQEVDLMVTDNAGSHFKQTVTVKILNVNERPTSLALSATEIMENPPPGTDLSGFVTSDPDLNDAFSYELVEGDGSFDNEAFRISKTGNLQSRKPLDFETKQQYFLRIRVTDSGGNSLEQSLTIHVLDGNDAPTAILLAGNSVEEEQPSGTLVGTLSTTDPDSTDSHSYSIVGQSDFFTIQDDQLVTTKTISRKKNPEFSVRIRTTDKAQATFEQTFTISVLDSPDAPTDIQLDNSTVPRYSRTGTLVGNLSSKDEDVQDTHVFRLPEDSSSQANDLFFIEGTELLTNHFFDEAAEAAYEITVEVEDSTGNTFREVLRITISDIEKPDGILLQIKKNPSNGGLVTGGGYYRVGETATIRAVPSPGKHFSGHSGDVPGGVSADSNLQMKVEAPGVVTSTFSRKYHKVTVEVDPPLHGFAHGGGSYLHGSVVNAEASELPASYASHFSHWTVNGEMVETASSNPLQLELEADQELRILAHFDYGLDSQLRLIPAGTFQQSERPLIIPYISSFYMQELETTKKQWYEIYQWAINQGYIFDFDPADPQPGRNLPHSHPDYPDNWPITGITWYDAAVWCNARSEMEGLSPLYFSDVEHQSILGKTELPDEFILESVHVKWRDKGYRLPTTTEWEKAARGKLHNQIYPNGNDIDESIAHFDQRSSPINLTPVGGGRLPNGFGLYDMAGNAWEICWDWYWKDWFAHLLEQELEPEFQIMDPIGPSHETVLEDHRLFRSVRGGDANSDRFRTRVDFRKYLHTWSQYAITVRPVVPGPVEPSVPVSVYTVTPHLGTVSGAGVYPENASITLLAEPVNGTSLFVRWEDENGTDLGSRPKLVVTPEVDSTFTAVFASTSSTQAQLFSLQTEVLPMGEGVIEGAGAYLEGAVATLTASPNGDNQFAGWAGDGFGIESTLAVMIDSDKMVRGYFGDTSIDSDRDGLSDLYETSIGSNAYWSDSDNDGIKDTEEVKIHQSNPTLADSDGDGFDDRTELFYGTKLTSESDFPFIESDRLARYFVFKVKPYDYSGNRGHGTEFNTRIESDRAGLRKNAYGFDGVESYFEATAYSAPDGSQARTFAFWVYRSSLEDATFLSYGSSSNGFAIHQVESKLQIEVDGHTIISKEELPFEEWFQVLVTLPEGGSLQEMQVYLNAVLLDLNSENASDTPLSTSRSKALVLGTGPEGFFEGKLDELRIWERYLATSEVEKLHDMEVYKEPEFLPPSIQEHPQDQTVALGDTATFTVVGNGKPEPSYQWQKLTGRQWVDVKGGNQAALHFNKVSERDVGRYRVQVSNSHGFRESTSAQLLVMDQPVITSSTGDVAFLVHRGGKIAVTASGSKPLYYEWFKDGDSLGKSTSNRYIIRKNSNPVEFNGSYHVVVSNPVGEVTSEAFNVSLLQPIEIKKHPEALNLTTGESGTLAVEITGDGTIQFLWEKYDASQRKWLPMEDSDTEELSFESITVQDAGRYRCTITNGPSTLVSKLAEVTVYTPPSFVTQPQSQTLTATERLTLSAEVSGSLPMAFQWQKLNPDSEQWEDLPKMVRSFLYFRSLSPEEGGAYRLRATNPGGTTHSKEAQLTVYYPPLISQDLVNLIKNEGETLDMTIQAEALDKSGSQIAYQWYFNRSPVQDANEIQGSKTNLLQISNLQLTHQGYWYCAASNQVGATLSRTIKLIVIQKPVALKEFSDVTTTSGRNVSLGASIRGGKPMTFEWFKNGKLIKGANRTKLYLRSAQASDSGNYTLKATNSAGAIEISANVTVTGSAQAPIYPTTPVADFQTAAQTDSDSDGLNDLLEHALGSDPNASSSTFVPHIDQFTDETGQTWVSFSYTENALASDLHFIVETSKDLQSWEAMEKDSSSISRLKRGNFTEVTYYFPAQENYQFFRVRIEP